MRRHVLVLVTLLVLQSTAGMASAHGRATSTELSTEKYDWLSNDTIEINVEISNAPYSTALNGKWVLYDENDAVVKTGNHSFSASGTVTSFVIPLKQFYNGAHFYTLQIEIRGTSQSVLSTAEHSFTVFENTLFPSRSNLIAFGDSLSDMGNGKNSILNVPDVPPYWQGRFSNGKVWLEHASDAYGVTTTIGSGTVAGDNRAFGGSQTGPGYSYVLLPNVGTQITNYLGNVQANIPQSTVVSLWSGGNDFLYGTANADTIATNMESHIRQLEGAGAAEFIIPNLPPLEKTPEIMSRSQSQQNTIAAEVVSYNQKLSTLATDLRAELGITIHFIDAWSIFNDILVNNEALGITNTQDAACSGGVSLLPLPICSSGDTVVSNVDEYLFFDKAHPTRVMHQFIGRYAIEEIGEPDTDGDGVINLYDTCSWTESGAPTNVTGCSWTQQDDDNDGVNNLDDECPNTALDAQANAAGCSAEQRDSDDDGLNDASDPCPFSPSLTDHDNDGCSDGEDLDDDNDGYPDTEDECPRGMKGSHDFDLDTDGCHDMEDGDIDGDGLSNADEEIAGTDKRDRDSDDDLVIDGDDVFPTDGSEWADSDSDGCGDNSDLFPFDSLDCYDVDEDGYGDNADAFPLDSSEWFDFDSDGIGDNADVCPLEEGYAHTPLGCIDTDGDGYGDRVDAFPLDINEWNDTDADGVGDNADVFPNDAGDWNDMDNDTYGDNRDAFPYNSSEWNDTDLDGVGDNADAFPSDKTEWMDSDADGCGNNIDIWPYDPEECLDQDFDGVGDNADAFPLSAFEWLDSDGDGLGDNADMFPFDKNGKYDTDGDGIANALDPFPNNARYDSWFDIVFRAMVLVALIAGGVLALQRRSSPDEIELNDYEAQTIQHIQAQEIQRPTSAPSFDAFNQNQ